MPCECFFVDDGHMVASLRDLASAKLGSILGVMIDSLVPG